MRSIDRRSFLAGAGVWIAGATAWTQEKSANAKLNVAIVGPGGRGTWHVGLFPRLGHNVVALCDVNQAKAAEAHAKLPQAARYRDFRVMLDEMDGKIDAVVVSTPDHTHAPIAAAAIRRGKHVYVEKPMAASVHEARVLRSLAREHRVCTQMGNQGTASPHFRRALELVRQGALGEIREVHVWNDGGGSGPRPLPTAPEPVPDYLDWNLWLGPAAGRPYHRDWMRWSGWRDLGTGVVGNWASHTANLAFMSLDLIRLWKENGRFQVEAEVAQIERRSFPRWERVRYEIPARGTLPPVTVWWHNGPAPGSRERIQELLGEELGGGNRFAGLILVGSKAKLHATGHNASFRILPEGAVPEALKKPFPSSPGHEAEWIRAIQGGAPGWSNFDAAGPFAEFLMLANVSTQVEGPLEYDPTAGTVAGPAEARAALRREYREGWPL